MGLRPGLACVVLAQRGGSAGGLVGCALPKSGRSGTWAWAGDVTAARVELRSPGAATGVGAGSAAYPLGPTLEAGDGCAFGCSGRLSVGRVPRPSDTEAGGVHTVPTAGGLNREGATLRVIGYYAGIRWPMRCGGLVGQGHAAGSRTCIWACRRAADRFACAYVLSCACGCNTHTLVHLPLPQVTSLLSQLGLADRVVVAAELRGADAIVAAKLTKGGKHANLAQVGALAMVSGTELNEKA